MIEFLVGLAVGVGLSWLWYNGQDHTPRVFGTAVQIKGSSSLYLRSFTGLDLPRAYALASRIARGVPIRYKPMVGKHRLLRRSEWDRLIVGEWITHGQIIRNKDKTLSPTPEFIETCYELLPPHARTRTHRRTE